MKGITPVIAVILLLLITISMVGFAFVWFTRLSQTAQEGVSGELNQTTGQLAKRIRIDNAAGTSLSLRNIGTQAVQASEIGYFINGAAATCAPVGGWTSINVNSVASCTLSAPCNAPSRLRVTAPAGPDEATCS
jgi:flagellin-like protein